jgi:hypothetical protein
MSGVYLQLVCRCIQRNAPSAIVDIWLAIVMAMIEILVYAQMSHCLYVVAKVSMFLLMCKGLNLYHYERSLRVGVRVW